jgi:hypothetical protein
MLARYIKSSAFTETENVMTKFCGDTRDTIYEYVHEFLLQGVRIFSLLNKSSKKCKECYAMHTCPACLKWRERSIFIFFVGQQPSRKVLFMPVKK